MLKKGDVVDGSFQTQDLAELVVHLQGDRTHEVLNPRAFDPRLKAAAHFPVVKGREFTTQEGGDVFGFDGVDGGTRQRFVERLKILPVTENEVGGILDLIETPVVSQAEAHDDRTVAAREGVEFSMQLFHAPAIGEALSAMPIGNLQEGIIEELIRDPLPTELAGQPFMPIEVDLQAEGTPSGHADKDQSQVLIEKVEVVMQALAVVRAQVDLAGFLVVPRPVGGTALHGRKDADQAGVSATFPQPGSHPVFFAEVGLADVLDAQAVLGGQAFGVFPQLIPQRFGEARIIENADAVSEQIPGHPLGITKSGQCALN